MPPSASRHVALPRCMRAARAAHLALDEPRPDPQMANVSPTLNVMISAARKAGRSLIRDFGEVENLQISIKGPANFVSVADHKAEDIIFKELSKARVGYSFLM